MMNNHGKVTVIEPKIVVHKCVTSSDLAISELLAK